eukprot:9497996-Pyramimonas_sp.AAC.1
MGATSVCLARDSVQGIVLFQGPLAKHAGPLEWQVGRHRLLRRSHPREPPGGLQRQKIADYILDGEAVPIRGLVQRVVLDDCFYVDFERVRLARGRSFRDVQARAEVLPRRTHWARPSLRHCFRDAR